MVKLIFSATDAEIFDTKVFLVDKKDNKKESLIKKHTTAGDFKIIENTIKRENFYDKEDDVLSFFVSDSKVILISKKENADELFFQTLGGKLAKILFNCKDVVLYLDEDEKNIYNLALGVELGNYAFNKYFTKKEAKDLSSLKTISFISKNKIEEKNYSKYSALAGSINYVRDLVNEPANYLTPEVFAKDISKLKKLGLEVEILEEKELKKIGFNLLLSVNQGSSNPCRVAVIKWVGDKSKKKFDLALVGKGVTFDSGGLSLKNNMEGMHQDMAGAGVVVGTMRTISMNKVKANIIGFVGLVENMPSGNATKVNDVVKSLSGQTVEILNTDAEGRLVLADLLTYAQKEYKVKQIIDLATLTGAIVAVFGNAYAGLFSNDDDMISKLTDSGKNVDEKLWNLPIDKYFDDAIKSNIADMQNIGRHRYGGSSQAACFLKRFINEDVKWAHLDIAGTSKEDDGKPLYPKGATGYGVKLLVDYITNNF